MALIMGRTCNVLKDVSASSLPLLLNTESVPAEPDPHKTYRKKKPTTVSWLIFLVNLHFVVIHHPKARAHS